MTHTPADTASDAATLHRLAHLMDEDNARTNTVGIPASYGHWLINLAVSGPCEAWDAEWVRLTRTVSRQAAIEWADRQEAQIRRLAELIYPGGATARARSAADVRALAASIAP